MVAYYTWYILYTRWVLGVGKGTQSKATI